MYKRKNWPTGENRVINKNTENRLNSRGVNFVPSLVRTGDVMRQTHFRCTFMGQLKIVFAIHQRGARGGGWGARSQGREMRVQGDYF